MTPKDTVVRLRCSACGRVLADLRCDAGGEVTKIVAANSRSRVRSLPLPGNGPSRPAGGEVHEGLRFYCHDRCGVRYSLTREQLDAAIRNVLDRAPRDGSDAPAVRDVVLPVRGPRGGTRHRPPPRRPGPAT